MIITIDGPTASGKSTVARLVAQTLRIHHLNTGLLYRALALLSVERLGYTAATIQQITPQQVTALLSLIAYCDDVVHGPRVSIEGKEVTLLLKTSELDRLSSLISAVPHVRFQLYDKLRELTHGWQLVCEGRDCGTVLFPQAAFQFFVTANLAIRAKRWQADQARRGNLVGFEQACAALIERDERDRERKLAPLKQSGRALLLNTDTLSSEEVAQWIVAHVGAKKVH
jgi:cytidylate kinase